MAKKQINIRFSEDEQDLLDFIKAQSGTMTAVIKSCIRQAMIGDTTNLLQRIEELEKKIEQIMPTLN